MGPGGESEERLTKNRDLIGSDSIYPNVISYSLRKKEKGAIEIGIDKDRFISWFSFS